MPLNAASRSPSRLLSSLVVPTLTPLCSPHQQYLQRRQQENAQRQSRGEPPLPEEDISKMFKPPQPPPRMDTLLIAGGHTHKNHLVFQTLSSSSLSVFFLWIIIPLVWKLPWIKVHWLLLSWALPPTTTTTSKRPPILSFIFACL